MAGILTPWKITSSWGTTLSFEMVVASVGVASFHLVLTHESTKRRILLDGKGAGVGAGVSVSLFGIVVGVDGSVKQMPSAGIGSVLDLRPNAKKPFEDDDFAGFATVYTGACKGMAGGSISMVIFSALPPIPPATIVPPKAVGFFAGMVAGSTLGIGVEGYTYYIHSISDYYDEPDAKQEIPQVPPHERPAASVPVGNDIYVSLNPDL